MNGKYFIQWLRTSMIELVITQEELGEAIGRDKRSVGRYLNDDNYSKTLENNINLVLKIISFVQEKACFKTYHHIDNRIFLKFFREYFKFLNQKRNIKILQQQLGDFIGVTQKTISIYLNPKSNVKFNAETQYKILNFFVSQNIDEIYSPSDGNKIFVNNYLKNGKFDYLGYFILFQKEWDAKYLFLLMQNKKIYSKIDKKMRFYILHYPPVLHHLIEKQFEACLRFAEILPSSTNLLETSEFQEKLRVLERTQLRKHGKQLEFIKKEKEILSLEQQRFGIYKIYQNLDSEIYIKMLEKILDEIIMAFEKKIMQQEILIDKYPVSDYDIILQMHLEAVVNYQLLGTKKEQIEFIKQVKIAFTELTESDKIKLFGDLQTIVGNTKPNAKRISQKKLPSIDDIVKSLCSFPPALQDILLEYSSVFFNFDDYFYFHFWTFKNHILYPFMKKILKNDLTSSVITKIESKAFERLLWNLTMDYEEDGTMYGLGKIYSYEYMHKKLQQVKLQESLEIYIKLYSLSYETIPDLLEQEFTYSEKNKQRFLEKISNMKQENLENLLEIISYKLKFYPEDWYLWGLIQIGMNVNSKKIYAEILKVFNGAEEIIELTEHE